MQPRHAVKRRGRRRFSARERRDRRRQRLRNGDGCATVSLREDPMARVYEQIDESLKTFIEAQQMFFVATAPLSGDGLVNLSPKGLDSFRILDPHTVAYLDLVGSGVETVAHVRENGRIVLMFCAFEGKPNIVRLHGRGQAIEPGHPEFDGLRALFPPFPGTRSLLKIAVSRIADSCGYGVPLYLFEGHRSQLGDWAERKGAEGLRAYKHEKNRVSLDGLPGLRSAPE
jgi:hypothetical protein